MSKFISVTEQGSQYCLRIFVRHAIVHGSYMLFSLGDNPSPEFPRAGHTSTRPSTASPAEAAPARATSVAVLEARNATLERELANLQAERGRGNGRGNGRGRGRPSQPRGDFVGRSDRGGRFNQGPNVSPNMQQTPSQYPSNPPPGMYGYPTYQYGYGGPYTAAPAMGGYPMQPYQQQYPGGWTGSQMMYSSHQDYSSQMGASSGFAMPPQQVGNPYHQGQPAQRGRGSSGSQQGQAPSHQGLPARPQRPASGSGASTHVPRPDAEEFYPGSDTHQINSTTPMSLTTSRIRKWLQLIRDG